MEEFYEKFRDLKITPIDVDKTINSLSDYKLNELVNKLNSALAKENKDMSVGGDSLYNFVATNRLSGGKNDCIRFECRLRKVEELANFSALYADIVLINNPFEEYLERHEFNEQIRYNLANDYNEPKNLYRQTGRNKLELSYG